MKNECNNDLVIDMIREDIREIKSDIKSLLKFKWQIMGGTIIMSFLGSVFVNIVYKS